MASSTVNTTLPDSNNNSESSFPQAGLGDKTESVVAAQTLKKPASTWLAIILGAVASIGGFIFGYESGQISGFLAMSDFLRRFGQINPDYNPDSTDSDPYKFSAVRQGTIVAMLCAGTLVGCLGSGWICDKIGRRITISASAFFYIIGVIIEITSDTVWVQFAMGRFAAGLGIGALSTSVPMYQSESVPKNIRSSIVASYQLLITLGIWAAYMVNWGTESAYHNSAQWRIPNGLSALWAIILGTGILFLPESPRFAYRQGKQEEARNTLARLNGLDSHDPIIDAEVAEIEKQLAAESQNLNANWTDIFRVRNRMLYRTVLGMVLQAGQQLTGANFFFYYSTTIFKSTGLSNSYVTSIILGSVNVVATIFGLWLVEVCGRRKVLICGALWMFMCFMIYTFVGTFALGQSSAAGSVLIVFTCLFIVAFATSWGPLVWAIVGELYPTQYRAPCMALATASNWLFNFLISFFTTFITDKIHYWYGMVFGGSCLALAIIVYFFVIESKDRSLEEIDYMYVVGVNPIISAKWKEGDETKGKVTKVEASAPPMLVQIEERKPEQEATTASI